MAEQEIYPRNIVLAGAVGCGVLLALAVHMLSQRLALDFTGMWRGDQVSIVPFSAAVAWWLIATVGFAGGYIVAALMHGTASGRMPTAMWQFLAAVLVLVLTGAGVAASEPSTGPIMARVLAGIIVLVLGAGMAFCGAHFATRRA
ncbi:hypothetical protein [Bradyrhizobium sp. LHD-71]|uniref:hypothetical protein n=1 Tax=Bradyrhizobium sp. LHD-71 TaxID=3072141 RepID=UPI00280EED5A|nr:hypothetical protein [Bradyrhizobium sp. LHD-71]MDQ8728529.1 hypothetical protein [Bradyrhizobium sp. LHD-71]